MDKGSNYGIDQYQRKHMIERVCRLTLMYPVCYHCTFMTFLICIN